MQFATQSTLADLVEHNVTSLVRESAVANRHSKRSGKVSAGDDDDNQPKRRRRLIHHDDVNMALSWRGSEKLYVSGAPVKIPSCVLPYECDEDGHGGNENKIKSGGVKGSSIARLLRNTNSHASTSSLLESTFVPRVDLNAYLQSDLAVRPPFELGMTLHWLAVEGENPIIPLNEVWNNSQDIRSGADIAPVLDLAEEFEDTENVDKKINDSSIRIRELQHRLLSEELQLYYTKVTSTIEHSHDVTEISAVLRGIRSDTGIQEIVPFLSRFVATGLTERRLLHKTEHCRRLIRVFDAMLDNRGLHLDLHLHQMLTPVGTCIVAKRLSSSPHEDHWALREEAAWCLVRACEIYGDQYTTMKPRIIKLLTQRALRADKPLGTQYGGIVGISLFGPRAVDAFLLPLARGYWEYWDGELQKLTDADAGSGIERREYELNMCQQALLNAMQIFMQSVTPGEKAKRVDINSFSEVFGERLIPMRPDATDYIAAVV